MACGEALRLEFDAVALALAAACGNPRAKKGCAGPEESRHEWDGSSAPTAGARAAPREPKALVLGAIRTL